MKIILINLDVLCSYSKYSVGQNAIWCYSCTTLNADRLLNDVQDINWKNWLENVRYVSRAKECNDHFDVCVFKYLFCIIKYFY